MEVGTHATSCTGRRGAAGELTLEGRAAAAQPGRPSRGVKDLGRGGGVRVRTWGRFRLVARILKKWKMAKKKLPEGT
jgi:hypothetical protein